MGLWDRRLDIDWVMGEQGRNQELRTQGFERLGISLCIIFTDWVSLSLTGFGITICFINGVFGKHDQPINLGRGPLRDVRRAFQNHDDDVYTTGTSPHWRIGLSRGTVTRMPPIHKKMESTELGP